jgi:hypothetical protein
MQQRSRATKQQIETVCQAFNSYGVSQGQTMLVWVNETCDM